MPDKKKSEILQKESKHLQAQIDSHFQRKVDRANRLARYIITFGGYGIIISIVGILLFLLYQSLPLSFKASLKKTFSFEIPAPRSRILLTGVDQYREISIFFIISIPNRSSKKIPYRLSHRKGYLVLPRVVYQKSFWQ